MVGYWCTLYNLVGKSELSPNIFQKFLKDQLLIQEGFLNKIMCSFFCLFPQGKECHLEKA